MAANIQELKISQTNLVWNTHQRALKNLFFRNKNNTTKNCRKQILYTIGYWIVVRQTRCEFSIKVFAIEIAISIIIFFIGSLLSMAELRKLKISAN